MCGIYQGKLEDCEEHYTKAIKIMENTLNRDNLILGAALADLALLYNVQVPPFIFAHVLSPASCLIVQGRYSEALITAKRALVIQEQTLGSESIRITHTLTVIGAIYINQVCECLLASIIK